jgi:hypothetical protein
MESIMIREIGEELSICQKCTYERGFHVSLARKDAYHDIVLICPNCGQRYSIGWRVTVTENA